MTSYLLLNVFFCVLALIWQLMRAYTLSILSRLANTGNPIIEKEIVSWVNSKLQNAGKSTSLRNFQDSSIADGKIVIDLVDSIKPGSVNYDNVKNGGTEEVCNSHAMAKQLIYFIVFLFLFRIIMQMPNMLYQWQEKLAHVYMRCQKILLKLNQKWL